MKQYETILSVNGQQVTPQRFSVVRKALTGFGLFTSVTLIGGIAALSLNAEFRSKVFFSAPVQAVFAAEIGALSLAQVVNPIQAVDAITVVPSAEGSKNAVTVKFNTLDTSKPLTPGQRQVTSFLAKRYRVSAEAVESIVRLAYKVGKDEKVEPTLILAIVGIESSFNPFAASSVGAHGLMQVMPKIHKEKFEALSPGDWSALNPEMNMRVGAKIIREYTRRTGSVNDGLIWYVGAAVHGNDGGYASKVLELKSRIDQAYQHGHMVALRERSDKVSAVQAPASES